MIIPLLDVPFENFITSGTLIVISALAFFLLSRKEQSLKLSVTSSFATAQTNFQAWGENYKKELIELGENRLIELKGELKVELNQWSSDSILALRTWLMDPQNLDALAQKLVIEPVTELMKSQSMSFLGKISGESRRASAAVNAVAEEVLPENIKTARDMLLKVAPQLKPVLKNPAKIMQLAQSFGIDINALTTEQGSNSGKSRW